jgi:hypothetical protein
VNVTLGDATEAGKARHRMMLNVHHGRDLYEGLEAFSDEVQDHIMGSRRRLIQGTSRKMAPPPHRRSPPKKPGVKKPMVTLKLTGLDIKTPGEQKEVSACASAHGPGALLSRSAPHLKVLHFPPKRRSSRARPSTCAPSSSSWTSPAALP